MAYAVYISAISLVAVFVVLQVPEVSVLPLEPVYPPGLLDKMPSNCSNSTFCREMHKDYPKDKVIELCRKYRFTLGDPDESPLINKHRSSVNYKCDKITSYDKVYEILDSNKNVRVVVQCPIDLKGQEKENSKKYNGFTQQLRIEQCKNPGRIDSDVSCVEETMEFKLVVLSKDGKKPEYLKTSIPVLCYCRQN